MKIKSIPEELAAFWATKALQYLDWITPWRSVYEGDFSKGQNAWFVGGKLNAAANCLDRHLEKQGDKTAIIFEGDDETHTRTLSYKELHQDVAKMANLLKQQGIQKGDAVGIYLPMVPEVIIAILACARIGAVHAVVFAGFSAQALAQRLNDAHCRALITMKSYDRGGKHHPLLLAAREATKNHPLPTIVVDSEDNSISLLPEEIRWQEARLTLANECPYEIMDAEDPLFVLYTSGSTGSPKGLVHTTGGYLSQVAYTMDEVFKLRDNDIFWCTADVGWITGHSYVVYGPLLLGKTLLIHQGTPSHPTPDRVWRMIDRHKVTVFYTAPTALRALKRLGDSALATSSRNSLRLLGSVGEPINPEVWQWYKEAVGHNSCPIKDTWWQTETGAIMLCPNHRLGQEKPGSAGGPIPGIYPVLLETHLTEDGQTEGKLAIDMPWPSMARTILGDHTRYVQQYFHHGHYITGDAARIDAQGDFWILGRIDDVVNVSGHRIGTAEVESAVVSHPDVAEAAAIGVAHPLKGQGLLVFASLKHKHKPHEGLVKTLQGLVKDQIGAIAIPDWVIFVDDLPKTRSGKIMRRILRKIANDEVKSIDDLGDISTLSNPDIVTKLMALEKSWL